MNSFLEKGKEIEQEFAKTQLTDVVWATKDQDINDHWDVQGILDWIGDDPLKFDVKGMKKYNRHDTQTIQKYTWIESRNVHGKPGWIKGQADYIVFERESTWVITNRQELRELVNEKVKEKNYSTGKGVYELYTRDGRQDLLTLVPFKDILDLELTWNMPK